MNAKEVIKALFAGQSEAEIIESLEGRFAIDQPFQAEIASTIHAITTSPHASAFPTVEEVDLDNCDTLTTTVKAHIYIPKGSVPDGSNLLFGDDLWSVGVWLYNDSCTKAFEPFDYGDTENEVTPTELDEAAA